MPVDIPEADPALSLWQQCNPADLEKFWHLLGQFPVKVGEIARALGISVISKTLQSEISGLIKLSGGQFQIEVNNTDLPVRQRFTVCHEISHYLLHRDQIDADGITDNILYRSRLSNRQEAQANKLAAAILLPWNLVLEWHNSTFDTPPRQDTVEEIAKAFKASRLAVGFRFGF
ncbi:ImmA/IrrE family metallo-endopeptidase [Novosphingobium mangrovi (ex Huang et al. 2023)]|uniref:ImmA/IrrE family metallo-endopeptidase n=1 Tax=Novosphingobium mangrovi (ex Huang et al. 2023) TaxID=2976432 RepID=A0ABT2I3E2_9SPHN|nr:ImmA/IrrE family metallo-endopeptidase [Novosphingobium mangrovi (ex Huang et al. 2023)]MCT2399324.1 ImmA/IrrE family metallo-endopeptidase [Novosphingobium mangrovi (ex Huang et al. 2023)]